MIAAGSIFIFVVYLAVLDWVTSAEVTQVYKHTFQHMRSIAVPPDVSGADDTTKILQRVSKSPDTPATAADVKKVRDTVEQLKKSERLSGEKATRLDQCVQFATPVDPVPQNWPTAAARTTALEECVQMLDPLRQLSTGQAIELDRLRLLKEYAKDAHEHRQAFRTFWIQAAQLVLLNLLLPLLTALLGYIFGSQRN